MILDVGCGSEPKGDVNVDLFPKSLFHRPWSKKITTKSAKNFIKADANFLPFRDDCFDIVFSQHTLEHCKQPFLVLQEMKRITKNAVIIKVPRADKKIHEVKGHLYSWTGDSLKHLLLLLFDEVKVYDTVRRIESKITRNKILKRLPISFAVFIVSNFFSEELTAIARKCNDK